MRSIVKGLIALAFAGCAGAAYAQTTTPAAAPAAAAAPAINPKAAPIWVKVPVPAQPTLAYDGYAKFKGKDKDIKLWYSDTGGKGEVIVLLHPWSQSGQIWKYQLPVFTAAGYRVISPSRRGAYKSMPGPKEDPGNAADDVLKLVDSLGLKKFHLVGVAAGGVTATAFAVAYPERLQSLLISNTVLLPDEQEWRDMSARLLLTALGAESTGASTTWREVGPNYRAGNPEGTAEWTALEHESRPNGLYNGQKWGPKVVNWDSMSKMTAPTLIGTGDSDLWAPPAMQRLFAQHLPNSEVTVIKESGHAPYWEQPEAFNKIVLDWVGSHKAATPTK